MVFRRKQRYRYRYTKKGVFTIVYLLLIWGFIVGTIAVKVLDTVFGISPALAVKLVVAVVLLIAMLKICRPGYLTKTMLMQRLYALRTIGAEGAASHPVRSPTFRDGGDVVAAGGGEDWRLADFRFNVTYRLTRHRRVVGEYRYISVLEFDLPRRLPAMVFDSRSGVDALGEGLDQSQRTTLGGNFDQTFVTYFPLHYQIDARSIISTPTMQAMLAFENCDFEIFDDKLHIYHTMIPGEQLAEFIERGRVVRQTLSRPLTSYRDHLVSSTTDRQNVSVVGARLRQSVWRDVWAMMLFSSVIIGVIVTIASGNLAGFAFLLPSMLAVLFLVLSYRSYRAKRHNNRMLDEEYKQRSLGRTSSTSADTTTESNRDR